YLGRRNQEDLVEAIEKRRLSQTARQAALERLQGGRVDGHEVRGEYITVRQPLVRMAWLFHVGGLTSFNRMRDGPGRMGWVAAVPQNSSLRPNWMIGGSAASVTRQKFPSPKLRFGVEKLVWLAALKNSARNSVLSRSPIVVLLRAEKSVPIRPGPVA